MNVTDLFDVLDALRLAEARCWVAGGWGVDVLVGRQTREHRDLDLALDAVSERAALHALEMLGYRSETDQRPARVELAAPQQRWVDLHPVVFDAQGVGRQADLHGGFFLYPENAFITGEFHGRTIPCLSASQQLAFRSGYSLRDVDRHDIAQLQSLGKRGSG